MALLFPNGAESDNSLLILPTSMCEWIAVHVYVHTRKFRGCFYKESPIYICAAIAECIDINFNTNSIFQNEFEDNHSYKSDG